MQPTLAHLRVIAQLVFGRPKLCNRSRGLKFLTLFVDYLIVWYFKTYLSFLVAPDRGIFCERLLVIPLRRRSSNYGGTDVLRTPPKL